MVGPYNKAEQRTVELGRTHGAKIIVTKGLKQGERVVAVGVQKVRSGTEVKPMMAAELSKDAAAAKGAGWSRAGMLTQAIQPQSKLREFGTG